ncbi:MAG: ABC transporter permease subunit [Nitrospiraceae bacterium]
MNWLAIWVTVKLASLTALILLVVGLPIAYWVSFSRWRWKFIIESVVALPLVLPPTVLGFHILVAIGPHSPFGRLYADLVGHPLPFTFEGLLFASVLYSLPFAVQPFAAAFEQVDRRLIEASWTLGVSRARTFFRLIVPLSGAGLVTGTVLSCPHDGGVRRGPDGRWKS